MAAQQRQRRYPVTLRQFIAAAQSAKFVFRRVRNRVVCFFCLTVWGFGSRRGSVPTFVRCLLPRATFLTQESVKA